MSNCNEPLPLCPWCGASMEAVWCKVRDGSGITETKAGYECRHCDRVVCGPGAAHRDAIAAVNQLHERMRDETTANS